MNREILWDPTNILLGKDNPSQLSNYAVLVLNTKISLESKFLLPIWSKATLRFTVDGGTNQWYKWLEAQKVDKKQVPTPHYITGDMDSIDVKILERVRDEHSCSVIVTDDQNETDYTKALNEMHNLCIPTKKTIDNVITIVDTAGRLDQIMANIHTLYKAKNTWPNLTVYQLANDSLSWLIAPGRHRINIPQNLRDEQSWCALLPVGERCNHVTTTGLKWDLNNRSLRFGELVSTSNTYSDQPYVTIETDRPLLWSMGFENY